MRTIGSGWVGAAGMPLDSTTVRQQIIVSIMYCRLNQTKSLINSHLYTPRCITRSRLPSVCNCGDDSVPACLNENSMFDRSQPTITYVTSVTDTCFHSVHSRYVYPFMITFAWRSKPVENTFQVIFRIILQIIRRMWLLNPFKEIKLMN